MVISNTILKTTMGILLIVVFYNNTLNAQNVKSVFENYYKWGVTVQLNTFSASNDLIPISNNNLSYDLIKHKRFAVGLTYNFYQKNT